MESRAAAARPLEKENVIWRFQWKRAFFKDSLNDRLRPKLGITWVCSGHLLAGPVVLATAQHALAHFHGQGIFSRPFVNCTVTYGVHDCVMPVSEAMFPLPSEPWKTGFLPASPYSVHPSSSAVTPAAPGCDSHGLVAWLRGQSGWFLLRNNVFRWGSLPARRVGRGGTCRNQPLAALRLAQFACFSPLPPLVGEMQFRQAASPWSLP